MPKTFGKSHAQPAKKIKSPPSSGSWVKPERILPLVSSSVSRKLGQVFGNRPIAVWGSRNSPANHAKFDRMQAGDKILIVKGDQIQLLGRVACKDVNPRLSQELWKNIHGETTDGWDLISSPTQRRLSFRSRSSRSYLDTLGTINFAVLHQSPRKSWKNFTPNMTTCIQCFCG
jgi:hypothetical protein